MLPSCSHATAQNLAEFAQNLEICTPKLEKSCIFTIFMELFGYFLLIFLRKIVKSKVLAEQENKRLEGLPCW